MSEEIQESDRVSEQEEEESVVEEEELEENEPYLGPAWAVVMLILYLLKEAFPAEEYSVFWWFQVYIIGLVIAITIFTLIKRHQFYRAERLRDEKKKTAQDPDPNHST